MPGERAQLLVPARDDLPTAITTVAAVHSDEIWIGHRDGSLSWWDGRGSHVTMERTAASRPNPVVSLLLDHRGDLWVRQVHGLSRLSAPAIMGCFRSSAKDC